VEYYQDPVFGFEVPKTCPDVPDEVLQPWSSWPSREEYDKRYKDLAMRFISNFAKFTDGTPPEVVQAGPKV
jgi:phosphoenolpyruvate carboxykinase (ATP)